MLNCCIGNKQRAGSTRGERLSGRSDSYSRIVQIALVGCGESGKSTFQRQLRLLYGNGFTMLEKQQYKVVIFATVIRAFKQLVVDCETTVPSYLKNELSQIQAWNDKDQIDEQKIKVIERYLEEPVIKEQIRMSEKLPDNFEYLTSRLRSLLTELPSDDDILKTRVKTHIQNRYEFVNKGIKYVFLDLAGQREARATWIQQLKECECAIYFAATSEFDQNLAEDSHTNRVVESMHLWSQLQQSVQLPLILLLNKTDLLQQKLAVKQFKEFQADYEGPNELNGVLDYFEKKYSAGYNQIERKGSPAYQKQGRKLKVFRTCATDTQLIQALCDEVFRFVLDSALAAAGFL